MAGAPGEAGTSRREAGSQETSTKEKAVGEGTANSAVKPVNPYGEA